MGKLPYILFAVALLGVIGMVLFKAYGGGGAPAGFSVTELKASINKAKELQAGSKYAEASAELDKVYKAAEENPGLKDTPGFVKVQELKANGLYRQEKFAEAETIFKQAAEFYTKSKDAKLQDDYGMMLNREALNFQALANSKKDKESGKLEAGAAAKAEETFKAALKVLADAKASEENVILVKENLGAFYRYNQNSAAAIPVLEEVKAYREKNPDKDPKEAEKKLNFANQVLGLAYAGSEDKAVAAKGVETLEKVLAYYTANKIGGAQAKEAVEGLIKGAKNAGDNAKAKKYVDMLNASNK